ncbi:SpoIIE family protein phosphatase [Cellulomonas endophytica]|uniref:SpoIIE family protein phosphatase n=1 Tax=Cellulomonas endophytica TaxID=2494735 RepID=UPI0010129F74|nr:SpoIIE family protein phosphatase [Cellulomonas endophytica]
MIRSGAELAEVRSGGTFNGPDRGVVPHTTPGAGDPLPGPEHQVQPAPDLGAHPAGDDPVLSTEQQHLSWTQNLIQDAEAVVAGGAQQAAARLEGDLARVAATRRLLRSAHNPALDRLVSLAARLAGTGAAQISLLAEAQVISATTAPDSQARLTPLADSLCALTAAQGQPLIIADARHDVRVADLEPVRAGAVRSYLGVPLLGQDEQIVGALCVFDAVARAWSLSDVALLQDLATYAVTELELSALAVEYEADRLRWQLAVTAGGVGSFDWDLTTGALTWDDQLLALFGLTREQFAGTIEAFTALVHPDDRDRVTQALQEAIDRCGGYEAEYRVLMPQAGVRWLLARGATLADPSGRAVRVLGAAYDTTVLREGDARISRVLETMSAAFFSLDHDWNFSYVNAEAERLLGRSREELLGQEIWTLFPAAVASQFEEQYRGAVHTQTTRTFEAYYPAPLDAWYEARAWPSAEGLSVYFHDISSRRAAETEAQVAREAAESARRAAEAARAVAEDALRAAEQAQAASDRAAHRTHLLARVSADLSSTLDTEEAVARLAQHLVPGLSQWCIVTLVESNGALRDVGSWHTDDRGRALLGEYREHRLHQMSSDFHLQRALSTRAPVLIEQDAGETIASSVDAEAARAIRALAPDALYVLPLQARGRVVGLVSLFRGPGQGRLSASDLNLASQIADRAGLAVDNARLYSEQHRMAEGLQRQLLSAPVEPDHLQIAVRYLPAARAAQVGGDWYDAFLQPDGGTVLVIGDVIGHDSAAAAAMSQVRTLLRGIAYATGHGPAQVLSGLDAAMTGLSVHTLATAVVARLEQVGDERDRDVTRLRWSSAGHLPPLLLHPDGTVTLLHGNGGNLLLGIDPHAPRTDSLISVDRGSTLLLYTDGLVERRGSTLSADLERLRATVAQVQQDRPEDPLDVIVDEVLSRMVSDRPEDDVALVAVRLHPHDAPRPPEAGPVHIPPTPAVPLPATGPPTTRTAGAASPPADPTLGGE